MHNPQMDKYHQIIYVFGIIVWILIGLSFLALVIDAITEIMRRQVKRRMEEMAAMLEQVSTIRSVMPPYSWELPGLQLNWYFVVLKSNFRSC